MPSGETTKQEVKSLKKQLVLFLSVFLVFSLAACTTNQGTSPNVTTKGVTPYANDRNLINNNNGYNYGYNPAYPYNYNGRYNTYNYTPYGTPNRTNNMTNMNAEASRMASLATQVKGVRDATVVIAGRNAYVGLNIDNNLSSTTGRAIEQEVVRKLASYARNYTIRVTSDATMFGRIRDINTGLRQGGTMDRYRTDFDYLDRNFMPVR